MMQNSNYDEISELKSLIWLQKVLGLGSAKSKRVMDAFGSAHNVFAASSEKRRFSGMFSPKELERAEKVKLSYADEIIDQCKKYKVEILGYGGSRYPQVLRNISDPPLVIYYRGIFPDFDNTPTFCIVGPRILSDFGKKAAFSLSARLSKSGMIIVSGGAVGGDSFTHIGAIKSGGVTAAVLPCGIAYDYLAENRTLRNEIIKSGGVLISETPPEGGLLKHAFQIRNRLLSALSLGVAVVEAGNRSGTLITAHHACEQGKDVFVIPGNPTLAHYKGSNELLREGAKPLLDASDIFNEYIPRFPDKLDLEKAFKKESSSAMAGSKKISKKSTEGLSKEAQMVYNKLNIRKFTADDIYIPDMTDDELLTALTELEIEQYIEALPGGFYRVL